MAQAALLLLIIFLPEGPAHGQQDPAHEVPILLHAHGALSGGWDAVERLQRDAAEAGIRAVVLTEHLYVGWSWGPPVLRGIWAPRLTAPSVMSYGPERYFQDAGSSDRAVPDVDLIVGLEVAPFYHWSGIPLIGGFTMWDWQKNLLVLEPPDPGRLRDLPVSGIRSGLPGSAAGWLWLMLLAAAFAGILWHAPRRHLAPALLHAAAFALLLWPGAPRTGGTPPYGREAGWRPWQALIDSLVSGGSVVLWSQIESVDDTRRAGVSIRTDPHPEALLETAGYTGWGAVYPTTVHAHEPGGAWDLTLAEYLEGRRELVPWGWGELALHYPEQLSVKRLDEVLTVLYPERPGREGLLDAMRAGLGYAVRSARLDGRLQVTGFVVNSGGETAGIGQAMVVKGEVIVEAVISGTGSGRPPIDVQLVRGGEVVAEAAGEPPLSIRWTGAPTGDTWIRLIAKGRHDLLLTNPTFLLSGVGRKGHLR